MINKKKDIKVKNLKFSYEENGNPNINDISFDIKENEYIVIIGQNGSGKSTLAKLLIGILKPSSGTIHINNILINHQNLNKIRKQIGVVFQNPDNQFIGTTVHDDIEFGLQNYNVNPELMPKIIYNSAKKVGIEDLLEVEPINLSGGQKQKVAIATIFALKPNIVVFDEATSMLDPAGKTEINKLIYELKSIHKKTILSISHDMDEAAKADRILLINNSQKVFFDTPENIFLKHGKELKKMNLGIPSSLKISENIKSLSSTLSNENLIKQLKLKIDEKKIKVTKKYVKKDKKELGVQAKDLNFFYLKGYPGEKYALQNVSCDFYKGEINAIIGNTGSGKSTLVQHINGLLTSKTGNIKLYTRSGDFFIKKKRVYLNDKRCSIKKMRKNVGLIFQMPEYQLFNNTVQNEICFAPINFGEKKNEAHKKVENLMNLVQLDMIYLNQNPFELSGGQKRRVAIASILSYDPEIIIFDEPTAGLDPAGTRQILDIIKELKSKGNTIILITHNMDHVLELSDNVLLFKDGKLEQSNNAKKLLSNIKLVRENSLELPYVFNILSKVNKNKLWDLPIFNLDSFIFEVGKII